MQMSSSDCWFFSCPCDNNVCQNTCSTLRVIQRRVRMPMTLSSSRKASLAVSKVGDTFSGPSDRLVPSVNTLTGKVGVDKKHNSFARYLARKTGQVLRGDNVYGSNGSTECGVDCCCVCKQDISNSTTGLAYIPQVGDLATQNISGGGVATGRVGQVGWTPPDLDWFTINNDDCAKPFQGGASIWITGPAGQTEEIYSFTITTTHVC